MSGRGSSPPTLRQHAAACAAGARATSFGGETSIRPVRPGRSRGPSRHRGKQEMTGKEYLKTTRLLAGLGGLLLAIGAFLGGNWITIMLFVAIAINGIAYFYSDKIAIRAARAVPVTEAQFPELYQIVKGMADKAGIPMPRLYVSPSPQPHAFATRRNPQNAAAAVTQAILPILDRRELEGVLAHELSHVQNRDRG